MQAHNLVKAILFAEPPSNESKSVFSTISDKPPVGDIESSSGKVDLGIYGFGEDIPYQAMEYINILRASGVRSATLYVTRHRAGLVNEYTTFTWVPDMDKFSHGDYCDWVRSHITTLLHPIYPERNGIFIKEYADNLPEGEDEIYLPMSNFKLAKSLGEVLNLSLVNVTSFESAYPIFKFVVNRD